MHKLFYFLIENRNAKILGKVYVSILKLLTVEIPKEVVIGKDVVFQHLATGTVIHPKTEICDNVQIFQGVTIGRADSYQASIETKMEGVIIENGAVICSGAKILCKSGTLTVGRNTIVGANAVLLESTGDNEVWAGVPAKKNWDSKIVVPEN